MRMILMVLIALFAIGCASSPYVVNTGNGIYKCSNIKDKFLDGCEMVD